MSVVRDDTMAVAGFEHHTFMCSDCKDVERRLIFAKPAEEAERAFPAGRDADAMPVHAAPPISPARADPRPRGPAPGLLRRMLGKLRGGAHV